MGIAHAVKKLDVFFEKKFARVQVAKEFCCTACKFIL
jgi:hypothetical protein